MARLNVQITDTELQLLEVIHSLGPCSSEKVHERVDAKTEYLLVMRTLHQLVAKGFLERIIINKKQFYKTSRQYTYVKGFLREE